MLILDPTSHRSPSRSPQFSGPLRFHSGLRTPQDPTGLRTPQVPTGPLSSQDLDKISGVRIPASWKTHTAVYVPCPQFDSALCLGPSCRGYILHLLCQPVLVGVPGCRQALWFGRAALARIQQRSIN